MYLYLVLAIACLAVAFLALLNAVTHHGSAVARLEAIIDYGSRTSSRTSSEVSTFIEHAPRQPPITRIATSLGGMLPGRLTAVSEEAITKQLIAAGMYRTPPRTIIGYRAIATVALPVLVLLLAGVHSMTGVLLIALAVFAGWMLPLTYVQRKARFRIEAIDRNLPDLVDLLCVTIEAGLSFPAAMRTASGQFGPPLGDELRLTLQEQAMGLGMDEALGHLAKRAPTPAMQAFVRSMAQGERMGISTGQIMRNLSQEMRNRRRARAHEKAQKTPVLMLFPLVFLIFPAMFIVLMTPAVIGLMHSFKGM